MGKNGKKKRLWIIGGILGYGFTNGILFYLYPVSFSAIAYIIFLLVPLFAVIMVVFARFSMVFVKRIEEKEEEEKLLQERQKEIFENMAEGLVVHDLKGKILAINSTAESFLNTKEFQLKGKAITNVENQNPLLEALFSGIALESGQEKEFSYKNKEGQELFYQIVGVFLNKERGEILKIIRDVTRTKYLDKMKTEYITIMSHKLLTPLTGIKWAAGILGKEDLSSDRKKENVKNILDNADKMIEFTSHLLNIAEIEEGLYGYKFEKINLAELIENVMKNYFQKTKQKNIKMIFNNLIIKESSFINGDKNRLETAVSNYLDNAMKYTPNDENGKIELSLNQDEDNFRFSVKDNGVGVSPESISDLFTKFFRDNRAKVVHTEGAGVGLFIVKNIIEKHKGNIGYEPSPDGGSIFYFTLPVYKK